MKPSEIKAKTDTRLKTENKPQHTKGEWKIKSTEHSKVIITNSTGKIIARAEYGDYNLNEAEANAQRIVKAVNIHDEFVNFLRSISVYDDRFLSQDEYDTRQGCESELKYISRKVNELLAKTSQK